jgi:mRNA interferase RelE/StbE
VTYTVVWELNAVDLAAKFLTDDPDGVRRLFSAADRLCDDPRPPGAFPLGTSGLHRLRVDRYRLVYEVDDDSRTVRVRHVGRRS